MNIISKTLTGTAALLIGYDAPEIPETRLTPVALQSPYSGFTGTLASGGVTSTPIGAMLVTLAAACTKQNERVLLTDKTIMSF